MKRSTIHLVALTSLLASGHGAAYVIYSGLQNTSIPTTYSGINIDVDGANDWDLNPFMGGVYLYNNTAFQPARDGTGGMDTVLNFTNGSLISSSLNFATGTGGSMDHLGINPGQFNAGEEGYIGFKLNGTDYGWMRVVFTNNTGGAEIKDWAYNTGGSIATGNVIQSGSTYTLDSSTQSFTLGSAISGSNSVIKTGANTVTLSGSHTYSGTTSISEGTLALASLGAIANTTSIAVASGAIFDVSNVTGGWTLGSAQTLTGSGGVTGDVTIEGTHNAGDAASNNGVGSQAIDGNLTYASGSIFEWDINASVDGANGSAGTDFDTVSATGTIDVSTTDTVFKVIFGSTALDDIQDSGNAFWNTTPYGTQTWDMSAIFGQSLTGAFQSVDTSVDVSSFGSFTINGSTLTWTAVPEPSTALAGLLLGAGLLRRRRK